MSAEVSTKRPASRASLHTHPLPLARVQPSFLRSLLTPSKSLLPDALLDRRCVGYWDEASRSVWVTDPMDVLTLWRRGFFGKGSLSRSEPSWYRREENRRGLKKALTSEEVTAMRRKERRLAKIAKAKEKLAAASGQSPSVASTTGLVEPEAEIEEAVLEDETPIVELEHLQLQPEEAFFLIFAVGALDVFVPELDRPLSILEAWNLFARSPSPRPDNAFMLSYVVYHHYRSLGWVARDGVKFCTDWVLYKGADGSSRTGGVGPVGGHAEFSVLVLPTYEDALDKPSSNDEQPDPAYASHERKDWRWFHTVNRVTSGVKKTLVMAYVTIPALSSLGPDQLDDPAQMLQRYSVREFVIKRWSPARMRD